MDTESQIIECLTRAQQLLLIAAEAEDQRTKETLIENARELIQRAAKLGANPL